MPSTYTDILGLELQETGENLNSWGDRLNAALRLIDDAQDFAVIPLSGNLVLSNTMNQPNQARKGALAFTDNGLTAAPTVTLPDYKRLRYVENRGATYAITFTAGGVAGVLPPGRKALVLCNGTDVSVVDWVAATDDARIAAQAARDLSQAWASLMALQVAGTDYSSKEYAVGVTAPLGSAKSWAGKIGSAVASSEFSAREHASGTAVTTGSAKAWAITIGAPIAGGEYAAKEYALGDLTATGGSAKAWATDSVSPDGSANKSAKSYASDAAGSATAAANSATSAGNSAIAAADSYDAFDDRYLGAKASDPTVDNDGAPLLVGALYFNTTTNEMRVRNASNLWQVQVPDAANYYTKPQVDALFGNISPILPITMTAPASGATDVGAGGTYTFVARAFVGDTIGFYSNYGVPVTSRFVNVYEPGGTNPVKTFTAAGGGPSLVANFTGSGLATSKAYQFEFGYTDAQGNTVKSPKVSATTASQFKPSEGQAYQGGFLGFQNFGDGDLFDLVVAPKSTEASKVWGGSALIGLLSRLNGPGNADLFANVVGVDTSRAVSYGRSISIGGVAGYLGAIDELRAISSKLKPSVAVEAAFKAGGAQVYDSVSSWSSTETTASNAMSTTMVNGGFSEDGKTTSYLVRAIKRVSTIAPYPIGTAMEGGTLAAYFTDLSSGSPVTYMLIVAEKSTEVTRAWDTGSAAALGYISRTNGAQYTTEATRYAAFAYANGLVSGGKTDWYLGAIDEMLAIARMNSQLPSAQQLATSSNFWTSTEVDASAAKRFTMDTSFAETVTGKGASNSVRPIRRVLLPAT